MADENPYNSLGQILAKGGEVSLGLAIYHGWSGEKLALLLGRRLKVAPGSDTDELYRIAQEELAAGNYLNSLTPESQIDPTRIPTLPAAFANLPEGTRVVYEVEYRFGDAGKWWRFRKGEADIGELSDINQAAATAASGNKSTYVAKEGITGDMSSVQPEVRFILAFKKF